MPKMASWCLKTGGMLRAYSQLDEQGVYIREVHTPSTDSNVRRNLAKILASKLKQVNTRKSSTRILNLRRRLTNAESTKSTVSVGSSVSLRKRMTMHFKRKLKVEKSYSEMCATTDAEIESISSSVKNLDDSQVDLYNRLLDAHDKSLAVSSRKLQSGDTLVNFNISAMLLELENTTCTTSTRICGGAFSILHAWNMCTDVDNGIEKTLGISPPSLKFSYETSNILYDDNSFRCLSTTCFQDIKNNTDREMHTYLSAPEKNETDSNFATKKVIALLGIFIGLKAKRRMDEDMLDKLITFYSERFLWEYLKFPPSLLLCVHVALSGNSKYLQTAARLLITQIIMRMTKDMVIKAFKEISGKTEEESILLASILTFRKNLKCDAKSRLAVIDNILIFVTAENASNSLVSFVAELIIASFDIWFQMVRQHHVWGKLVAQFTNKANFDVSSRRVLLTFGLHDPVNLVQTVINNSDPIAGFEFLVVLVHHHKEVIPNTLAMLVDFILKCLDPSDGVRKRRCYNSATKLLHQLVKYLPMCDFSPSSQRLVIGDAEGKITVFSLNTSSKFKLIKAHNANVTAVVFEAASGDKVATYCSSKNEIKLWNVGASGLLTSLVGSKNRCLKTIQLDVAEAVKSLLDVKLSWVGKRISLERETSETYSFQV